MIGQAEQSRLIGRIYAAEGIEYEKYMSAAGIQSNLKIHLPEALARDPESLDEFTGHIVEDLGDVDVYAATGGAVSIARAAATLANKPLVVIQSYTIMNIKYFRLNDWGLETLKNEPAVGMVEDVTSTNDTLARATRLTGLEHLIVRGVACWRRGRSAPTGMSDGDISRYNKHFAFRDLLEHELPFPMTSVIERFLPLWIPVEKQIQLRLPELAEV